MKMNTHKENSLTINFEVVKKKREFSIMGILSLVEKAGGKILIKRLIK